MRGKARNRFAGLAMGAIVAVVALAPGGGTSPAEAVEDWHGVAVGQMQSVPPGFVAASFDPPAPPADPVLLDANRRGYETGKQVLEALGGVVLEADGDVDVDDLREILSEGFCFIFLSVLTEEEEPESPVALAQSFGRYLEARSHPRFDREIARLRWEQIYGLILESRSDVRVAQEVTDALLC